MDSIFAVPFLVRIILSLFSILVLQKITKRLDVALLLGTVVIALWTGHSVPSMYSVAAGRIFSLDVLCLCFVIAGVIWLSSLMSHAGIMKDLVTCLKARLSKRSILIALPAVVGLLPMPAGALFSCPLIDDADDNHEVPPDLRTKINYWFRHVWEFCWPLYPGMLLATDISGWPVWQFSLLMFPMFLLAIAAGYVTLLRGTAQGAPRERGRDDKPFFVLILPVITVIVVYALLLAFAPAVGRINRYLPMAIGIVCSLAVLQLQRPASPAVWKKTILSWKWPALVLIVILARLYGAFIEGQLPDGSLLMDHVRQELNAAGIPALLLIIIIPFISGLTTGITIGYIGASFPVVLSLAGPGFGSLCSTIIIGYASGYIGMMLSPIHVCLIVTNEYFKTSLPHSLHGLVRPALVFFVLAAMYAGVWRVFG